MSTQPENQVKNEQAPRVRFPKHMKMPRSVKTFSALGPFKTKEERNHYQRSMAIAIHEFNHRVKKTYSSNKVSDAARATAEPEADTTEA